MVNVTNETATNVSFLQSSSSESNSLHHTAIPRGPIDVSNSATSFQTSPHGTKVTPTAIDKAPSLGIISTSPTLERTTTKMPSKNTQSTGLRIINPNTTTTQQKSISPNSTTETHDKTTKSSVSSSILKLVRSTSSKIYPETEISSKSSSTLNPEKKMLETDLYISDTKYHSSTDQFRTPTEPKVQPATPTKRPTIRGKVLSTTSHTIGSSTSTNIPSKMSKFSVKSTPNKRTEMSLSTKTMPVNRKSVTTSTFYSMESQSTNSNIYLISTKEPVQTMGAGALVIVVLLPFLALFLIAVVTALRRKMKKSGRRPNRYQNRNTDTKLERNQSQMVPLTRSEETQ